MSWTQNPNEAPTSPPTFYYSKALTEADARAEFRIVFDEVMSRREIDNAPEDSRVLFVVNSVNSYVDVSWINEANEGLGDWTYTVWLNDLGEACLDHEDGADEFVRICKFSIYDMVYDYYYDTYGDEFETTVCHPFCYFLVPEYRDTPEYIIM